jgi:hypothetical protein
MSPQSEVWGINNAWDYAILSAIAINVAGLQAADGGALHEFNVLEGMARVGRRDG